MSETSWNFDIEEAPRGKSVKTERQIKDGVRVIETFEPDIVWMASSCGKVIRSYWIPESKTCRGRWAGFSAAGEQPIAWQPYVVPSHPEHRNTNDA